MPNLPITSILKNPDVLLSALGHEPQFHDAEVISLSLDRTGRDQGHGPDLFVEIHLFDRHRDPLAKNGVRWVNHKLVTFRFVNVALLELRGFNQQNAIFDLLISKTEEQGDNFAIDHPRYRVEIVQSFGLGGTFICGGAEVESVAEGPPRGSVYADEASDGPPSSES